MLVATPTDSPTGRNLAATRTVRLGLGHTRDVSMIDGEVEVLEIDAHADIPDHDDPGRDRPPIHLSTRQ